jgi:hypothetical protein
MTLIEIANRLPPAACRYLARKDHGHTPMSHRDIAQASGLSKSTVAILSLKRSWNGVPIDVVVRFSSACGVDLMNRKKVTRFLRTAKRVHMRNASPQQKKFFQKMFTRESV